MKSETISKEDASDLQKLYVERIEKFMALVELSNALKKKHQELLRKKEITNKNGILFNCFIINFSNICRNDFSVLLVAEKIRLS